MKKIVAALIVILAAGLAGVYALRDRPQEPQVTTARVTRGSIVEAVGATGALEAVTTVQVGSQVSGNILELHADFNSIVRKGQVLARLDPSLFETQIEQARANLVRAQAEVERLRVTIDDARTKLSRARDLDARKLIPRADLETAEVTLRAAEAQLRSAEAQVTQAQASLNQNQVNLQHTVIHSPIDGIVISRNVDVGQTVAASMQAPTLFLLAADLTKMKVSASIDEADVGRIRPGQHVVFRVDAYPTDDFTGTVSQVRLQPTVLQNVVTYSTVIEVPNPELKLKPGMTANVTIEIARRDEALRIPNGALRFRPTREIFAAFGQSETDLMPGGPGRRSPADGPTSQAPDVNPLQPVANRLLPFLDPAVAAQEPPQQQPTRDQQGRGGRGFGQDPEQRRRMLERFQQMSPEEQEQMRQRMRGRGLDPDAILGRPSNPEPEEPASTGQPAPSQQAPAAGKPSQAKPAPARPDASTIDSLFGPLPPTESTGRVWLFVTGQLKPVRVRLGISDGTNTELLDGDLEVGTELVTGVTLSETRPPATTGGARSPLMPGRPGGGQSGPPGVRNPAPGR
jgi:HlyD family secretion protein